MAKNDMIDRQILIADLMDLKVALGDVFFGAVLDRAIECVERQPAIERPWETSEEYPWEAARDDVLNSCRERRDGRGRNEI